MNTVDIHPDHDELTLEVLPVQIENKEYSQICLQVRQEQERKLLELNNIIGEVLEKEVLQEHIQLKKRTAEVLGKEVLQENIDGPPSKKRVENINVKRNEEYIEQGQSSSQVTKENTSASGEISIESINAQRRSMLQKLVAEYAFPPDISTHDKRHIIRKLRNKSRRMTRPRVRKNKKQSNDQKVIEQDVERNEEYIEQGESSSQVTEENTSAPTCLQETQEPERKIFESKKRIGEVPATEALQKPIDGPPSKKGKENINMERNQDQGGGSSQLTEENTRLQLKCASAEISIESNRVQRKREFEKLVAEYPFPPDISTRDKHRIIRKLRTKSQRMMEKRKIRKIRKDIKKPNDQIVREQDVRIGVPDTILKHSKKMSKSANKTRVAINCSFDSLMSERAVNKLVSQMQHCYRLNRKMSQPLQLYFTHFKDKTLTRFNTALAIYKGWDVFIKQETLTELYSVNEVVYLCTKSDNVIETLDDNKVYVIGGFVGDGPHEDIVLDQANTMGFNTARLPIQEKFRLNNDYILTISDMFKIISTFSTLGSWEDAIRRSVPKRRWLVKKKEDAEGVQEEMGSQRREMRQKDISNPKIVQPITKMSESTNNIRISIDCSFDSLMTEKQVKVLCELIKTCYYVNILMTQPFQLYLTHFKDKTFKCFNDDFPMYKDWDIFIKPESLPELYSLSEVVYLCAESDNVLQTLDDNKIYVIGGSLDHREVLERSKVGRFNTARLPIQDHFRMKKSNSNVLALDHVFKILSNFSDSGCWKEAIKCCGLNLKRKGLVEMNV